MADRSDELAALRRRSALLGTVMLVLFGGAGAVGMIGFGAQLPWAEWFSGMTSDASSVELTTLPAPVMYLTIPGDGASTVNLRAGPSPEAKVVLELAEGTTVVADASAMGSDGTLWVHVRTPDDTEGFIAVRRLRLAPSPAADAMGVPEAANPPPDAANVPEETPSPAQDAMATPELPASSSANRYRRSAPVRIVPATPQQSVPQGPPVTCILPGGEEVRLPRDMCRARDGVVF